MARSVWESKAQEVLNSNATTVAPTTPKAADRLWKAKLVESQEPMEEEKRAALKATGRSGSESGESYGARMHRGRRIFSKKNPLNANNYVTIIEK